MEMIVDDVVLAVVVLLLLLRQLLSVQDYLYVSQYYYV